MATLTGTSKKARRTRRPYNPRTKSRAYKRKFARVMREAFEGKLRSGKSGTKVTSAQQAKAIAHSEALKADNRGRKRSTKQGG